MVYIKMIPENQHLVFDISHLEELERYSISVRLYDQLMFKTREEAEAYVLEMKSRIENNQDEGVKDADMERMRCGPVCEGGHWNSE